MHVRCWKKCNKKCNKKCHASWTGRRRKPESLCSLHVMAGGERDPAYKFHTGKKKK